MKQMTTFALMAILMGCDGGGGGSDAGSMMGSDGGGTDGGGGGTPVDFTLEIFDSRDDAALAGAQIALDHPDGTRDEQTTDAMGRATFSVVWAEGAFDLTAYLDGYALASVLDLTEANHANAMVDGVVRFPLQSNADPTLVTLSGTITNPTDPTHNFQVSANDSRATLHQAMGPDYSMEVPTGATFTLTVLEYTTAYRAANDYDQELIAAATFEAGPFTADSTLDLDLSASPVTFMDVSASVGAPGSGTPLASANFYANVVDLDDESYLGSATHAEVNGANVDYTMRYFESSTATRPMTRYSLNDDPNFSQVLVEGYPASGMQSFTFLPPPAIVSPAFGESHGLHEAFTLGRLAPGTESDLLIYDHNQDDRLLWQIVAPNGGESITIPDLPSAASASAIFPAGADVFARPFTCERVGTGPTSYCGRLAIGGRQFDLVP